MAESACVKRNSYWATISCRLLVPGDIVKVQKGDIIPADMVILKCNDLKVCNEDVSGHS